MSAVAQQIGEQRASADELAVPLQMVSIASQQMSEYGAFARAQLPAQCLNFMKAIGRLREKQKRLAVKVFR